MHKLITPYALSFGRANVIIKHFPDTESYVQIPRIESLRNKNVTVYHRLYPEPDKRIFELILILSCLKKYTKHVEIFVPYLPYARQDRECTKGEAVSADVLCGLLKSAGVQKLITYDCHFLPKPGNFVRNGLKIGNRSAGPKLVAYARKYFKKEKFLVISPDEGASYFTESAQGHDTHKLSKVRHAAKATGHKTEIYADVDTMEGECDVTGKNVCILDDMIQTGSTILTAIDHLYKKGAKKIIVGTTHGIFAKPDVVQKIIDNHCHQIFTTNSILQDELEKCVHTIALL